MSNQRTYSYLCLFSLSLIFINSFLFWGSLIFDTLTEQSIDQTELLENETESETNDPNPLEEEEEPAQLVTYTYCHKKDKSLTYHYRNFIWSNYNPVIPKEPPKQAV